MSNNHSTTSEKNILCLGDSYTIGEAVPQENSFPFETLKLLQKNGYSFTTPEIIAKTGWTTDELATAIKEANLNSKYDIVTLLIGVNNQYRKRSIEEYKTEFTALLETAISFSKHGAKTVFILSIPDWGITPFVAQDAHKRTASQISIQIEKFNLAKQKIAAQFGVKFINITPISQEAKNDSQLLAEDGLHPSGKMYLQWAKLLATEIEKLFLKN